MKNLEEKQDRKLEGNLHAILAGLLLNGFIQGGKNEELNDSALGFAKKEMNKIISKIRRETAECVCDKMIETISIGYDIREKALKEIKIKIIKEL